MVLSPIIFVCQLGENGVRIAVYHSWASWDGLLENSPAPPFNKGWMLTQPPILLDLMFPVQWSKSISRQLNLNDVIYDIPSSDTSQATMSESSSDICKRDQR